MEKRFFKTSNGFDMPYVFYRQGSADGAKLPAIVYLHGTDGCGSDPQRIFEIETMASQITNGKLTIDGDMILLTPQCPEGQRWSDRMAEVKELIEFIIETENADPDRISLTGCSLGGMGTFSIAIEYPQLFAAAVPVCGSIKNPQDAAAMSVMPVRIYHGTEDHGMGFSVVDAARVITEAGGDCQLTMLQGEGHEIRHVYYDRGLAEWMISQKRKG
ncbi:MAG: prolyl oligopeptidase family serine peptidase [Clostridia bacterium]|nr:prolyl oligopeptidase family serine peptidase [Clostridia bacterium]